MPSMAKINRPKDYKYNFNSQFFFDTNVWLLLFAAMGDYSIKDQTSYSCFLDELIRKDNPIFITSMVLSEFSNVILRRNFKQWVDRNNYINKDFKKDYIGSNDYTNSVDTIGASISKILKLPNVHKVGDDFNSIEVSSIITDLSIVDFNDSYIYQLSVKNNYTVVTNDRDFQKLPLKTDIVTEKI